MQLQITLALASSPGRKQGYTGRLRYLHHLSAGRKEKKKKTRVARVKNQISFVKLGDCRALPPMSDIVDTDY